MGQNRKTKRNQSDAYKRGFNDGLKAKDKEITTLETENATLREDLMNEKSQQGCSMETIATLRARIKELEGVISVLHEWKPEHPIPRPKFQYGQAVDVKIVEMGHPPSFRATVSGLKIVHGKIDYTVMDERGSESDDYSEDWLSLPTKGTET